MTRITTKPEATAKKAPGYEDVNSTEFIDRYGQTWDAKDSDAPVKQRLGIFAVIVADGHMLLNTPPWAPDIAELPGGGARQYETLEDAMIREIEEETGLVLDKDTRPDAANEYFMNLYAEDVHTFYHYTQKFYYYDLSGEVTPDTTPVKSPEGGMRFWVKMEDIENLPLRFGHKHIIDDVVQNGIQKTPTPNGNTVRPGQTTGTSAKRQPVAKKLQP